MRAGSLSVCVSGHCVHKCTYLPSPVPLAPLDLAVLNVSSTSLNVTWSRPTFVRGVLLAYEVCRFRVGGSGWVHVRR